MGGRGGRENGVGFSGNEPFKYTRVWVSDESESIWSESILYGSTGAS